MPRVYEFKCNTCDSIYELSTPDTIYICCTTPVKRIYSLGAITFKGSGFYKNDSRKGK